VLSESHDSPPQLPGVPLLILAQRRLRQGSFCHLKQWGGKGLKKPSKLKFSYFMMDKKIYSFPACPKKRFSPHPTGL